MSKILWLPSMSVGIEKWDSDHRVLLGLINRLDEMARDGQTEAAALREAFDTLSDYAEIHFRSEEEVMAQLRYPRLKNHMREHELMRQWIAEQRAKADAGGGILREVAEYLVHWLYTHVLTVDMQYSDFFEDHRREIHGLLKDYPGLAARGRPEVAISSPPPALVRSAG